MTKHGPKLYDISDIPGKVNRREAEWLKILKSIPKGKALGGTREQLGSREAAGTIIRRYTKKKLIPKGYCAMQRTVAGKILIFIIHKGKS